MRLLNVALPHLRAAGDWMIIFSLTHLRVPWNIKTTGCDWPTHRYRVKVPVSATNRLVKCVVISRRTNFSHTRL